MLILLIFVILAIMIGHVLMGGAIGFKSAPVHLWSWFCQRE